MPGERDNIPAQRHRRLRSPAPAGLIRANRWRIINAPSGPTEAQTSVRRQRRQQQRRIVSCDRPSSCGPQRFARPVSSRARKRRPDARPPAAVHPQVVE
ncbi:unnamed protein product [Lampetra planeri]